MHIRETVPDTFLKQADQMVNLDLAIEDLVDRLRSGKIYARGKGHRGAGELLPAARIFPRCANWPCAKWPRASIARPVSAQTVPAVNVGLSNSERVMVCDGVEFAAGRRAVPPRIAAGGPVEHRLVRRLRGNAWRIAQSDRCRDASGICTP